MRNKRHELKTKSLTLREITKDDREGVMKIIFSDEVKKTYMIPDYPSEAEADKLFVRLSEYSRDNGHFVYGIALDGKLIGFMNEVADDGALIELGYVIEPSHWGRGYATEALSAAISELFDMGYDSVRCGYFIENPASGRVMEKCGMSMIDLEEDIEYKGKLHHCLYREIKSTHRQ